MGPYDIYHKLIIVIGVTYLTYTIPDILLMHSKAPNYIIKINSIKV